MGVFSAVASLLGRKSLQGHVKISLKLTYIQQLFFASAMLGLENIQWRAIKLAYFKQ